MGPIKRDNRIEVREYTGQICIAATGAHLRRRFASEFSMTQRQILRFV
jgi:hypothetical protein